MRELIIYGIYYMVFTLFRNYLKSLCPSVASGSGSEVGREGSWAGKRDMIVVESKRKLESLKRG